MPDRKRLVFTLWLPLLLALLASVLVAPDQMSGSVTVSSRPACLCPIFDLSPVRPTPLLIAETATDLVLKMKAIPSEDEEQDRADDLHDPRVSFPIPCSFRKVHGRRLAAAHPFLSLYPLRC